MDCTLATLHAFIACFSWSHFYIDGGLAWSDAGVFVEYVREDHAYTIGEQDQHAVTTTTTRDTYEARNPYGVARLGYELALKNLTWTLELQHQSSLETGSDRGVNSVTLTARWYPFR